MEFVKVWHAECNARRVSQDVATIGAAAPSIGTNLYQQFWAGICCGTYTGIQRMPRPSLQLASVSYK